MESWELLSVSERTSWKIRRRAKLPSSREMSQAHITASVEIGTFGIRDMATGVMLTVSLEDAMEIMKEAIDASKKE